MSQYIKKEVERLEESMVFKSSAKSSNVTPIHVAYVLFIQIFPQEGLMECFREKDLSQTTSFSKYLFWVLAICHKGRIQVSEIINGRMHETALESVLKFYIN